MGRIPWVTISAFVVAKDGKTRPGQSIIMRGRGGRWIVWKCLVFPGVLATATHLAPARAFKVDDFPTLGYPTNPIVDLMSIIYQ
jgi:hypothetical protein